MGIYEAFLPVLERRDVAPKTPKRRKVTPGLQPERLGKTRIFVVPSSSGRTAAYPRTVKLDYYRKLRDLIESPAEAPSP